MATSGKQSAGVRQNIGKSLATLLICAASGTAFAACWWHLDCEEADEQTRSLLAEFGTCANGEACRVFFINARLEGANELGVCIDNFTCSVAIREDADQEALVSRARDIVSRRRCNTCSIAKCKLPENLQAFCDPDTKRCKLR